MNKKLSTLSVAAMLSLLAVGATRAQDGPARGPTRDVVITYKVARTDAERGAQKIVIKYDITTPRVRIDSYVFQDSRLPYQGSIFDGRAKTLTSLMYANQVAMESSIGSNPPPGSFVGPGQRFEGGGSATIAGIPCKEWRTVGPPNPDWTLCVTPDGAVLRSQSNTGSMEAVQVNYGDLPANAFDLPPNTQRRKAQPKTEQPAPAAKP